MVTRDMVCTGWAPRPWSRLRWWHVGVDAIGSQQRFIENMGGRTAHFSTSSDARFDETAFEAELTEDRIATMVCWYWILKLQARVMSGDFETAIAAARKAKAPLWSSEAHIQLVD